MELALAAVVAVVVVGIVAVVVLKIAAAAESQTAAAVAEEIAAVTAAAGKETAAEQEVVVMFDRIVAVAEIVVDSVAEKALGCVVVKNFRIVSDLESAAGSLPTRLGKTAVDQLMRRSDQGAPDMGRVRFLIQRRHCRYQIRQSMYCIEPGGAPSLVLPF